MSSVGSSPPRPDHPAIDLVDVSKTYVGPPPVTALRQCSIAVRAGEFVTITGASGSGKSTLLNILGLLDTPTTGRYRMNGVEMAGSTDASRAALRCRHLGFVFQAFHLLDYRTAVDNVALAMLYQGVPVEERTSRAEAALRRVGVGHRLEATASMLSGGERQRVAIARAVVHAPTLLLCDEPTGNLDSANAAEVLDLLEALNAEGSTIMLVTHDPDVARRGSRQIRIRDGVVTDDEMSRA